MFKLFQDGFGCRTIAEKLNGLGYRSRRGKTFLAEQVRVMLKNPGYCGDTSFNRRVAGRKEWHPKEEWIVVKDTHEPLVSRQVFDAVQAELKRRGMNRTPGEYKTYRKFAGLIECAHCGGTAVSETGTGKMGNSYFYYSCRTRGRRAKNLCPGFRLRADALEEILIRAVLEDLLSDDNLNAFVEMVQEKLRDMERGLASDKIRIRRKLEGIQQRLRKVVEGFEEGILDSQTAKHRTKELQEEREELTIRLGKLNDISALRETLPTKAVLEAAREVKSFLSCQFNMA
jgi:hypothetical protein